jgi:hypothetical protein
MWRRNAVELEGLSQLRKHRLIKLGCELNKHFLIWTVKMAITFDCIHCNNSFAVGDEHAGKQARCKSCNNVIQVPAATAVPTAAGVPTGNAVCPGCSEPVLPEWNNCPSCQTPVSKQQPVGQPPLVQAGNDNVIKTTVNAPTHSDGSTGSTVPATASPPAISMGDGNVVKANIDQSTNVTHDKSVNVQGQYVAQQTVVNESGVGTILKMLSSSFSNKQADEISEMIEAIQDDRPAMMELLRKSLLQLVRQMKVEYKEGKSSGMSLESISKSYVNFYTSYLSTVSFGLIRNYWSKKDIATKRIELCKKILEKLHDSAIMINDQDLLGKLDTLDDHLISLQTLTKKTNTASIWSGSVWLLAVIAVVTAFASFGAPTFAGFVIVLACAFCLGLGSVVLFRYVRTTREKFESEIKTMERTVPQLLDTSSSA